MGAAEKTNADTAINSNADKPDGLSTSQSFLEEIVREIVESPLNLLLITLIAFLVYKIIKSRQSSVHEYAPVAPPLPPMKKRDFTIKELQKYDGVQNEDGRVLVAVLGNVYDVTKNKGFYGPGGPYAVFGGRDASRGLATFSVSAKTDEYDDLSDLNTMEMDSVKEWEEQFKEKYDLVGRLLKTGEEPINYSDEEDEASPAVGGESGDSITDPSNTTPVVSTDKKTKDE